jgi:hypothetical protein
MEMNAVNINREATLLRGAVRISVAVSVVLLAAVSLAAPSWNGSMGEEDGWPVTMNPATPMGADEVIQPEQMWRIGGDDEDVLFGLIDDALVDEAGNTYLLDSVLSSIYVVDAAGEITRTIGGEGDGPGEFRFAQELIFLPNGDVGIMEMMPGKIVVVDREGTPRPSFALGEGGQGLMNHLQHIDANGDAVLIGKVVTTFGEGSATTNYTLSSYDAEGSEQAVLMENKEVQSGGNISLNIGGGDNEFTSNFTLCPDGRVVVFQKAKEYRLDVFDAAGAQQGIIRRDYKSVRRSDKSLAAAHKQAEEMRERFGGNLEMEVEEYARDISDVIARPDGEIWVVNSQGDKECPEQSLGLFDVFDESGRYSRRVRIEADYDSERDNFCLIDDRLYIFKEAQKAPPRSSTSGGGGMMIMMVSGSSASEDEDEDEEVMPYEVICYRLPR